MLSIGEIVQTSIGPLQLEDRVLYDPSARQYEPGWWAFHPDRAELADPNYFISDDGIVYANSEQWPDAYDVEAGHVLKLCRECDGPIHGTGYDVHESCRRA